MTYRLTVAWGDCDAAGIVFYANYYRWMDAAFQHLLAKHSLNQRLLMEKYAIIGTGLVDSGCRFVAPVSDGDELCIASAVNEWTKRTYTVAHRFTRGGETVAEGFEKRAFFAWERPGKLKTVAIADEFRALLASKQG